MHFLSNIRFTMYIIQLRTLLVLELLIRFIGILHTIPELTNISLIIERYQILRENTMEHQKKDHRLENLFIGKNLS